MREGETAADPNDRNQQSGRNDNLASHLRAPPRDVVQQEPVAVVIPVVEVVPVVVDSPVVGHGIVPKVEVDVVTVDIAGFVVGVVAAGLRPPAPSSVEPNGTPTRATVDPEPIPVGDEADAAGPAKEALFVERQVPDADPAMPPPSNTVGDIEVPAVETPVPDDVPDMELPVPDDELSRLGDEIPVPDAVAEVARPNDDSAMEPPMPLHPDLLPVNGTSGDAPDASGLTPGDPSPVAPRGIRVGGTGKGEPMPSGDVMPSGGSPGETCAKAGPQIKSAAAVVAITIRVMSFNSISTSEFVVRRRHINLAKDVITHLGIIARGLPRLARYCLDRSLHLQEEPFRRALAVTTGLAERGSGLDDDERPVLEVPHFTTYAVHRRARKNVK
jgi:hypothetical protein